MVDFTKLMFWVDDWTDVNPGIVGGQPLKLIAIQKERRIRKFWKKSIKNWIYRIGDTKMIVYKEYPLSPAVMKMGLSGHFLRNSGSPYHKYAKTMEFYFDAFVGNPSELKFLMWRDLNDYELV